MEYIPNPNLITNANYIPIPYISNRNHTLRYPKSSIKSYSKT